MKDFKHIEIYVSIPIKIKIWLLLSNDAYGKDTYYRFVQPRKYNWHKLLILSSSALISKVIPPLNCTEQSLLIIDDTVESKRGKKIEGSCKSLWSNKDHKLINGLNIVSLDYADSHSTFQLDFAIKMNEAKWKEFTEFTQPTSSLKQWV